MEPDSLDGVNKYWALLVELEYCPNGALESVTPEGDHISLTPPSNYEELKSYVRSPSPYLPKEAVSRKPDNTKSYYETAKYLS